MKGYQFKNFLVLIVFFLSPNGVRAQELKLNFKHISYKEGLVQSPISNFLQDDKGFIWFGNLKGLNRYDGYEFKTFIYDENDKKSISNNRVNIVFQDSYKNLWIGTANGVNLYNRDLETFTPINVLEIKGGRNYISSIIEDHQKNLWIGTFAGIRKLNRETQKLEEVNTLSPAEPLRSKAIFSLFLDKENNIWAGTKQGLRKFNPKTGKLIELPAVFNLNPDLLQTNVLVSKQDSWGNLWFGTETSGVFKYEKKENRVLRYVASDNDPNALASNWVKDILIYDKNTVWFATRNGVSIFNLSTNKFSNHSHDPLNTNSLNDNAIWSFMKDKSSCIWIGTFAGGINFYYQGNSNFINIGESIGNKMGLNHILVNAIVEDNDGSLWVGTFGGGLNHLDRSKKTSEYYYVRSTHQKRGSNGIKSLADDGKGNLWIGSLDGLSLFNKKTKSFKYFNFPVKDGKLSQNLINVVLPDGPGVWVGTNGGGLRYVLPNGESSIFLKKKLDAEVKNRNPVTEKYLNNHADNFLSDNFVTALLKDANGDLWIGTQNGLNYYDVAAKKITRVYKKVRDTKYQINNSNITSIFKDSKDHLWVGTEGGGLNYFDKETNRFYAISKTLGLGDDVIHAIVEDKQQNLWLSTDLGLFKLKITHFVVPFASENIQITSYTANDGLINNRFSGNAGMMLSTNELIFGGINGLSIFYPGRILKNTLAPKVALTQILINNKSVLIDTLDSPLSKSISEEQKITVNYDQADLSFKYSALNFINSENNQYAYKLEGLQNGDEWQHTGSQRVVNFANLSPGDYTFKVKAANNDGVWGTAIRSINIVVLPPWWHTWWAYSLYVVITAAVLTVIMKFLRNRAKLKRDLYLEHINYERQQELYQMKLNFFTNISHEIRTPLTLILGPLEKLLATDEQIHIVKPLTLIKNNADRLLKLVTELLDFRKAEEGHLKILFSEHDLISFCNQIYQSFNVLALDKNIAYEFLSQKGAVLIYFEKNQLEKVIFNLLSNAFKFTEVGGKITLNIQERPDDPNWVDISVSNNGKSIPVAIQEKLFESFFQANREGEQMIGSGVGLALSKSIVELHKGVIKVSSEGNEQALTIFTVSLQMGKKHLKEAEISNESTDATSAEAEQVRLSSSRTLTEDQEEVIPAGKKRYKLLIAEDNEEVRKLIVDNFIDEYNIVVFANGIDALEFMKNEIPDLIISDVMMPGMDGLELCQLVKSAESTNHIPFILLTARSAFSHQVDGLSKGADAYISKPFSLQILALNVKNLLKAQQVMREKFSQQLILQASNISITSPEEKFIHKLMEIIEHKMGDPDFDVNELVNEIGMSRTVLYKKVQTLTNYSVADLIKHMRLKKAAEILKVSTLPVAEVAYLVGFNDRKHFSKAFKKQFLVSPTDYMQDLPQKG